MALKYIVDWVEHSNGVQQHGFAALPGISLFSGNEYHTLCLCDKIILVTNLICRLQDPPTHFSYIKDRMVAWVLRICAVHD